MSATFISSPSTVPRYTPTVIESNTLVPQSDTSLDLNLGEGVYVLRDKIQLAAIPPHPADPPAQIVNVLDTRLSSEIAGSQLTLVKHAWSQSSGVGSAGLLAFQWLHDSAVHTTSDSADKEQSWPVASDVISSAGVAQGKEGKESSKRRKPKNNVNKSSSSFISRFLPHENLSKRLQNYHNDGLYAFVNINRALLWLDLSSAKKADQLCKILFTRAHPLCHDANHVTQTSHHIDLALGFSTNDILWYEPFSQRYSRINKNGIINSTPVAAIRWIPGSETTFVAAHFDGTLVFYDKEREDGVVPEDALEEAGSNENAAPDAQEHSPDLQSDRKLRLRVLKSLSSKNQRMNPVAIWKMSNERIRAFEFSSDGRFLAVVGEDASLRIIDVAQERLLDIYSSYYGGLTSVAWSHDGKYVVTGGQDDIVSVWSLEEKSIVARGVGHHSWISGLAFDPWRCDERTYRFASIGEDCRLLLWDFSSGTLHRPTATSVRQSIASHLDADQGLEHTAQSTGQVSGSQAGTTRHNLRHSIEPRSSIATLPPILSKVIDEHPVTWLSFEEHCIIASCRTGHILTWDRPSL